MIPFENLQDAILTSTINFPELIVVVGGVPQYGIQYLDYDGTLLYAEVVAEGENGRDPVAEGLVEAPTSLIDVSDGVKKGFTRFDAPMGVSNSQRARAIYNTLYYRVRFYAEDNLLDEQWVKSGMPAIAPDTTSIFGFKGWDAPITNISESIDVHVEYAVELAEFSWADISLISAAGDAPNRWDIGDTKPVHVEGTVGTLSVNQDFKVYILGFNHNSAVEGNGITFGGFKTTGGVDVCLVDSAYNSSSTDGSKKFNMNHWGNNNYGGWRGCDMRYDILGSTKTAPSGYGSAVTTSRTGYDAPADTATNPVSGTLMAALPADLRAVMQPMTKWTDGVGNSSKVAANVVKTIDYLPLLAEFEIFGARTYANEHEQSKQAQYEYYRAGNSKVKYQHSNTGSTAYWWERSARSSDASDFCIVDTRGTASYTDARYSLGVAPAFKV